jgi:RHS repeat-associated protein
MSARAFLFFALAVVVSISSPLLAGTATSAVPPSAPHGARVVIAGSGLDQGTLAVIFTASGGGTAAAVVVSRTASLVEVTVPSAASSGAMQVTAGGAAIGTFPFTLLPDPPFAKVSTIAASDKGHDLFKDPSGVAVIPSTGAVVIADRSHHQIAVVAPNGQITILAGSGKPGLADGAGAQAKFKEPRGIAVDDTRQFIYVADGGNNVIRRITYGGAVTTFAGSGRDDDFKQPAGLAIDAAGNVYVADTGNSRIRVITPQGAVTTIAGGSHEGLADGAAAQALFKQPEGIAVDGAGSVFVADTKNNVIRSIRNGLVSTIAGTGHGGYADGAGNLAEFREPSGISVDDAGIVYVADTKNNLIRRISPNGTGVNVSTLAGTGKAGLVDGDPAAAKFNQPAGIAFASALYIADTANDALRVVVPALHIAAIYPNAGPVAGGNQVRILGTGFLPGVTQVSFGLGPATAVTFITSTELLVTAPAGSAGVVDVKVTTSAASDVLAAAYSYLPPPTISSVTPVKGKTAGGDTLAITGTNFLSGDTAVTVGGVPAASIVVTNSSSLTVVTPPGTAGGADISVTTSGGAATKTAAFTYFAPPVITSFAPAQGGSGTSVTITGQNFDPAAGGDQVLFGTSQATITSASATQIIAIVPADAANGKITIITAGGSVVSATDFIVASFTRLQITSPTMTLDAGQSLQFNAIGVLTTGGGVDVTSRTSWSSNNGSISVTSTGVVTATAAGGADITASFNGLSATVHVSSNALTLPPDPATVAPAINATEVTSFADKSAFLYSGSNPIQTGVAPNAITPPRASVVRGRVLTRGNLPLPGVRVSIAGHPELGQTLSRADGRFDLAVNGGGWLTIHYDRRGLLAVDRDVNVAWNEFTVADDVALSALDTNVTLFAAGAPAMQVARGTTSSDHDGARTATILFPAGTTAAMTLPNGTTQPLASLAVRATEYTVGPDGERAMPATLPPTSSYTYCVELSADEALTAGAASVTFSKPVVLHFENFLNMPVGTIVPVGYYDRARTRWVASDNGRVIKVLSVANGIATIDSKGTGVADDAATLAALGVGTAELQQLGRLYAAGQSLWRSAINHFTPVDCNFLVRGGPPKGARAPKKGQSRTRRLSDSTKCGGSIIDCHNQTLGERIGLAGTALTLNYNSGEQRGHRDAYRLDIPITDANPPAILTATHIRVSTEGQTVEETLGTSPNLTYTYSWDGRDAYGRLLQGEYYAHITIGFEYEGGTYDKPDDRAQAFAQFPNNNVLLVPARGSVIISTSYDVPIGAVDPAVSEGLGGWTLSSHHLYDPHRRVLHLGTGETRSADDLGRTLVRVAGNTDCCNVVEGVDARNSPLDFPISVAAAPDGSFYITQDDTILHVLANGVMTRLAGTPGHRGFSPDGTPALQAQIKGFFGALGPDGFYFIDAGTRVRRIGADGTIVTVAGNGTQFGTVTAGPALQTYIDCEGLAVAHDGTLYIASSETIERVTPDGQLSIIAGVPPGPHPTCVPPANGVLAQQACLFNVLSVAVGPADDVYFADTSSHSYVAQIGGDGLLTMIAGRGTALDHDGVPATSIDIRSEVWGMDVARDGTVYFATLGSQTVRSVRPDGIIGTVAGGVREDFSVSPYPDNVPAVGSPLFFPWDVKVAPDGSLLIVSYDEDTIHRITPALPGANAGETVVGSATGNAAFVFDAAGRHLRTVDAKTGVVLTRFGYAPSGLLTSATDRDGNTLTIQRAADGKPTAIIAPGGQQTQIAVDGSGYLTMVTDPGGEIERLTHTSSGLLMNLTSPRGGAHTFTYDSDGLLLTDADPAGGKTTLSRTGTAEKFTITRTTAEGRVTRFDVDNSVESNSQRTTTSPSGLPLTANLGSSQSINVQMPGMLVTGTRTPHPQFGMASPFGGNFTFKAPSGRTLNVTHSKSVSLSDSRNPLSVQNWTHSMTVNGRSFTSAFDVPSRTLVSSSPAGRSATRTFDTLGHLAAVTVPGISTISVTRDTRGRVTSTAQDDKTETYSYNALNLVTAVTDPLGRTMSFEYDPDGRPTKRTLVDGRQVSISYDADGNVTTITPPGRPAHTFAYDAVDQGTGYTPPPVPNGGAATQLHFNRDRQPTLAIRPDGAQVAYGYDTAGRLNSIGAPSGSYQFSYDATTGLLASATAPGVALTYTRDGVFPTTIVWSGAVNGAIAVAYDNNLRPVSKGVTGGTNTLYAYDDDGLVTAAGPEMITRDAANGRVNATSVGVVSDTVTYDSTGAISDRATSVNGTPLVAFHYTRDAGGRITSIVESPGGASPDTTSFTYDTAGRLASVTRGSTAGATYSFDANSNRVSRITPSSNDSGTYDDQDRVLTYGGATFTYTSNGEIASRTSTAGTTTYGYDSLGRLVSVSLADGRHVDYVLDARGRRVVKKIDGAVVSKFLYENGLRPIAQLAADDSLVAQFVYAERGNSPSLIIRGGVTYRVIADHLGSPRYVVDTVTGAIADTLGYDEFGVTFESTPGFQPFGFAGGIYDADTKLVHFGAREYDPSIGRFLTKDPLGLGGGLNVYDYAANDPVNLIDPSGLLFNGALNAGEGYGQEAVNGYADTLTDPNASNAAKVGAAVGGFFASLWTPCTSDETFTVLVTAATLGAGGVGEAGEVAAEAAGEELPTNVIGKQVDTAIARDWLGHEVLDLPPDEWTLARNDAWVQQGIDEGRSFYLASEPNATNLSSEVHGLSAFGRETAILDNAGYTRVGDYLVPPR